MPKRELSKCREWERERRDRLKTCFTALGRLLPCYDPSVVLSKLEILQRAAAYIEELQRKNKDLVLGDENVSSVQNDEIKHLHERVRKLVVRNEQLANLLHDAGIKVPSECGGVRTFREPLLWSNRITAERAEVLRTRHMANTAQVVAAPSAPRSGRPTNAEKSGDVNKLGAAAKERQTTASGTRISTSGISAAAAAVLGPGTLILANGSVVPVLPPPVHLVVASTAATTTPPIIVMRQPRVGNLPLLKPKVPGGCTRTTTVNKLPIPALSSRHALTNFVHNNRAAAVGRTATTKKRTRKATTPATTATGPADKGSSDCVSVQSADGVVGAPAVTDPADGVASTGADVPSSVVTAAEPNVVSSTAADALSSDLFATLHVSAGTSGAAAVSGHAECMSPTAAFLLAFPLVSTLGSGGRVTEVLVDSTEDTPDSRQGTPTTLLQIGGTMMLDNKPQHQPPTVPLATTASSTSTAAGGLVDTFGPFGFATASDKDLHYDLRPAPAISTYEHSSQVKVVGSKSCVYEQQQQHGKSTGRTEPAASVTGSNSTAYNPFADLYVPPVQSSLYSAEGSKRSSKEPADTASNFLSVSQLVEPGLGKAPPPLLPPAPAELAGDYTALLADTSSMVEGSEDRRRTTASKRNTSGRHQPTSRTTEPPPVTTGAAGFAELGFLSMPAAATTIGSSPLLPDEFHAHTFPPHAAAPQLYQQNPLYPRRTFVPQPEVRNSSSSGPAATTGANTLTNFNLTTIFPEMNKVSCGGHRVRWGEVGK
ncbi:hypothetical protein CBL_05235 [Carabus blaptoides fortunei]